MNCIIIDDEPLAREELKIMLDEISEPEVIGSFSNALPALDFLEKNKVDLIFLDIEMPGMSGLELIDKIPEESLVIFTTAYSDYALKSYELNAIDYLLKPFADTRLRKAVEKALQYKSFTAGLSGGIPKNFFEKSTDEYIIIKAERRFYKINYADIQFIEGLKDYVVIYTPSEKIIAAMNLKTIHKKITLPTFIRVSKSYIVNTTYIKSFDNNTIYINDTELPIGDVYRAEFFKSFTNGF